ncbi:hypothetical protein GFY24_39525 [Nocardia sp. SYP-A9097]|uniref:SRPBCC family protein n=1 Tax=Nocardia sp. SYP-A9097 TaxID=2663237 RepID=UPI00129B2C2E|nr:SRPBCC family protein [Nocardia sp. SYP-A9097]MRH93433.1 hypothetical protein [Nocardia sp. SYP-A9097]
MSEPITRDVVINGPKEQVFDVITQARFWPAWHVLTRAVTGTIERPFLPGDVFTEFIRTPEGTREVPWVVLERNRPDNVTIKVTKDETTIKYTFEEVPGGTLFRRTLTLDPTLEGITAPETEEQSVAQLKALVETVLGNEKKDPTFP